MNKGETKAMTAISLTNPSYENNIQPIYSPEPKIIDVVIKNIAKIKDPAEEITMADIKEKEIARRNSLEGKALKEKLRDSSGFKIISRTSSLPKTKSTSYKNDFEVKSQSDLKCSSLGKETFELV